MSIENLKMRARLIRTALLRRDVHHDIAHWASRRDDLLIRSIAANVEPLAFLSELMGNSAARLPNFHAIDGRAMFTGSSPPRDWSSEPNAAAFVGRLVALKKARSVCEIGSFIGYTTLHIADALRETGVNGHVHYVDIDPLNLETAEANLDRLGLSSFGTAVLGGSLDENTLAQLPAEIDVAFIDTTHAYADTMEEIAVYGGRLTPQGCLVLHDSIAWPGVRRAIADVRDMYDVFTFATERGNGISVLTRRN